MKNNKPFVVILYVAIVALLLWLVLGVFDLGGHDLTESQLVELFRKEQVHSFVVKDGSITLQLHEPYEGKTRLTTELADVGAFRQEVSELLKEQTESGVLENYDFHAESKRSAFELVIPMLIVGFVLLLLWALIMGRMNSHNPMSNFGKARTVLGIPDGAKVTFQDVAGADEEKEELQEVVDFLRDP